MKKLKFPTLIDSMVVGVNASEEVFKRPHKFRLMLTWELYDNVEDMKNIFVGGG